MANKHKKEIVSGMGWVSIRCGRPRTFKQFMAIISDRMKREQVSMPNVRLEWKLVRPPYTNNGEVCVDYSFICHQWNERKKAAVEQR